MAAMVTKNSEEDEGFEIGVEEKVELLGGVVFIVRDPEFLSRWSRLWSKSPSSQTYFRTSLFELFSRDRRDAP